jgi:hypothetical protein
MPSVSGQPADLTGGMAAGLRARDTTEIVTALRALAAAAERLADAIESDAS